jgi:hypothetical protein
MALPMLVGVSLIFANLHLQWQYTVLEPRCRLASSPRHSSIALTSPSADRISKLA